MESEDKSVQLTHKGAPPPRHFVRRVFALLRMELVIELAGLLAGLFSGLLIALRRPAIGFNELWMLVDGLMAWSLVMLLTEAWLRFRAGRLKKLKSRAVVFGFILLGYLLFQVVTGRLAQSS